MLPQTLHPYVYVNNNPVNLTDPSGKIASVIIAIALGMLIGGGAGGIIFAITNPCTDLLRSPDFWQSILVGALSGGVAGLFFWAIPALLPTTTFWGAVGVGALSGSLGAGAGQITSNLLTPGTAWDAGLAEAMLLGGLAGGALSGLGWKIGQWIRTGREWKIGDVRIAPFGNRTGHPTGELPHYHRRVKLPSGATKDGQGIGRHRPWDVRSKDKSFWDRF